MVWGFIEAVLAVIGFLCLATYYIPFIVAALLPVQNLRTKYGAKWALVTGGSGGIGKAICLRLASQGTRMTLLLLSLSLLLLLSALLANASIRDQCDDCGAGRPVADHDRGGA